MWDFFRIVSAEMVGANISDISEAGLMHALLEVVVVVALAGICGSVAAAVLPSIMELGGIMPFLRRAAAARTSVPLHRPHASEAPKKSRSLVSERTSASSVTTADSKAALLSSTPNRIVESQPVVNRPAATSAETPDATPVADDVPRPPAAGAPHVDIDAVLDEFCDEEDLMDEAFVTSIVGSPVGAVESRPVAPATAKSRPPAEKANPTKEDAELAKRMMKAFAVPDKKTSRHPPQRSHPNHAAHPMHPPPTVPHPKFEAVAAPKTVSGTKVTQPSAKKVAVDLDAVFDEFEMTEEALNDALLDAIVAPIK
jgi:hypothetical protein